MFVSAYQECSVGQTNMPQTDLNLLGSGWRALLETVGLCQNLAREGSI
jgi:hypothetical protein